MKKIIAPLAVAATVLTLYACMTSSNGNGTTHLAWEWDETVTSLNQTSRSLITQHAEYNCVNGAAVATTIRDTSNYYVNAGNLYIWTKGECGAETYSGTSTTIIGTWTDSVFTQVAIPTTVRPVGCTGTVSQQNDGLGSIGDYLKNGSAQATVSTSNVHFKFSGDLCFAPIFGEAFAGDTSVIKVVSSDCQTVQIKAVQTSQTASITTSFSSDNMAITFQYGTKTCTLIEPFVSPTAVPSCSANNSTSADSTFSTCVDNSGFGNATAKRASQGGGWGMSVPQAIHASIHGSRF